MKNNCSQPNWYVLYTKPNYEKIVDRRLSKKGVETFLPLHVEYRQWSDRKKRMEVPLFQRYIFVNIRPENRYQVFETGVIKFVSQEGAPAILKQKEIDSIKQLLYGNPIVSNADFIEGEMLRVVNGPMQGLQGILINRKGSNRLAVRLEIMNRYLLVDIAPCDMERISFPQATNLV